MSELSLGQLKGLTINSNKITVPSGHTLYAPGHVLQTVTSSASSVIFMSSSTFQNTGLSASITPKSTSSKILVITTHPVYKGNANSSNAVGIRTLRGGSEIQIQSSMLYTGSNTDLTGSITMQILDSPNTTSQVTYSTQFRNDVNAAQVAINYNGPSTITLMEVAA